MTATTLMGAITTMIERCGLARRPFTLLVLLACSVLGPATAAASPWPTREQIQSLHAEVDQLSAQLDTLEATSGAELQEVALEAHWRAMQQHLVSVRENGCKECGTSTAFGAADDPLPWTPPRFSVPTYVDHMRNTQQSMHNRLFRLRFEKMPFERGRLLRYYWQHVHESMQGLREPVGPDVDGRQERVTD